MTYEQTCLRAATDQGLDPIIAELRGAGIPHYVDQTGGFTMCVNVPLVEGGAQYLYLTDDGEGVYVCRYWDTCDHDDAGFDAGEVVPTEEVADYVRRVLRAGAQPCPDCEEP